ncbi:60Kd inner membrane protein-domain-containing protein [Protomyces lactucae-debilis]|uniref:60Kd inner membrane protein-domain-containing protein n=1 Tax=Protomyces lactucae-debilis TaxID=2754530 RepID=A0A1Y2F535_PROLT|nr:60Kd inner membrane protein-domain-containing protein [Protomyces lactucae-debilis]ORY78992.1 60Kd inner membrane protein-domain-containing protein [Protomyces lactucae-debilis]
MLGRRLAASLHQANRRGPAPRPDSLRSIHQYAHRTVLVRSFMPACSPFVRHNSTKPAVAPDAHTILPNGPDATTPLANIPEDLLAQPPPFTTEAAQQALHSIGTLQELGLAKWYTAPGILQQLLEFVHVSTGFAWVASIAAATLMIRISLFPLLLRSIRNTSKLALINPQVKEEMAKLTKATKEGDKMEAARAQMTVQNLFKEHGVNPLMAIIPVFVQMPVFIFFYMALNKMVALPVPGMEVGGLFWFQDLTAADPTHILPVATAALTLINFEIGAEVGSSQGTQMNPIIKTLFRGMMMLMPLFTWNFPAAIFGYWFTNSVFSLCQGFAFRNEGIRSKLNLPPLPAKVLKTDVASAPSTPAAPGIAGAAKRLEGGFWKNFNETVQGVKDLKMSINDKAEAAAQKARDQEAAKPKQPTKFEDMDDTLQKRKIRQQERIVQTRRRRGKF